MRIPHKLQQRFSEYQVLLVRVQSDVKQTLESFCEPRGYNFACRVKEIDSLAEKIETGRFQSWQDIDDLFACTVIVPTLSHEEDVFQFCDRTFRIEGIKRRGETKKLPEQFRYDSTRVTAHLRSPNPMDPLTGVAFEIQIRSVFDHAWMVATHDLTYKSDSVDWKRQRIAAQIKAVVEQLDMLLLAFEDLAPFLKASPSPTLEDNAMIATSVERFFLEKRLPSELRPKDLSRFSENFRDFLRSAKKHPPVSDALERLERNLSTTGVNMVPKSLSLLQYFMALLFEEELVAGPFKAGYYLHVTQELTSLYPDFASLGPKFLYE